MRRILLFAALLFTLLAAACAGGSERTKPDVQKPDLQKPERTVEGLERTIERPEITPPAVEPNLTPGARRTPGARVTSPANLPTPGARLTLPANLPTPGGTLAALTLPAVTLPPITVANAAPVSGYDAMQMITTFAQQYLGAKVSVPRAGGVKGSVSVPSVQQAQVDAAPARPLGIRYYA